MSTTPRVYVASLHDYNAGRLEGKWIDLEDHLCEESVLEEIQDMLDILDAKYDDGVVREEWAYHDFEGFPHSMYNEYNIDFDKIFEAIEWADTGYGIEVVWAFLEWCPDGTLSQLQDRYYGEYNSDEEFVRDLLTQTEPMFWKDNIPSYIHIDWERTTRDIMFDYHEENGYYFRST